MAKQTQSQKDWYERNKNNPEWLARREASHKRNKNNPEWIVKRRAQQRVWYEQNKDKPEFIAKRKVQRSKPNLSGWKDSSGKAQTVYNTDICFHRYNDAKYRANRKGIEFNLTPEWFVERIETGTCEATGLPFNENNPNNIRRGAPFCHSIDRVDNAKDYTMSNCRVVCNIFNNAKSVYTDYELYLMSKSFVEEYENALGIA